MSDIPGPQSVQSAIDPSESNEAAACTACGRPLSDTFYRLNAERSICPDCTLQLREFQETSKFALIPWLRSGIAAFVTAIACGVVWALVAKATDRELGLLAIGVGLAVSWVAMKASGRRGPSIQVVAITMSVLGILIGKGLILTWVFWDELTSNSQLPDDVPLWFIRVVLFLQAPYILFSGYDVLWYGFAIWQSWRLPRAPKFAIDGPYSLEAADDAEELQFDHVQPTATSSPDQKA